jgi:diguanylate cyclase (GGDEF)-like protein
MQTTNKKAAPMLDGTRILVVDDEKHVRNLLKQVLCESGHAVSLATNGEEALGLFKLEPYPIVVTDIRMEGMNGFDLMRHITEISPETQVIIITSHASTDSAVNALRDGAFDYLIKPFDDLDAINQVVNTALDNHRKIVSNNITIAKLENNNAALNQTNTKLLELANRDALTGLHNRRHFDETLEIVLSAARKDKDSVALLLVDPDDLKAFNDQHGKIHGDKLLRGIANLLIMNLRTSDFAARVNSAQFAIIMPSTGLSEAYLFAEKIRERIATHPFEGKESKAKFTASIGVALFPNDAIDPLHLMQRADRALSNAKLRGKNRINYDKMNSTS